MILASDIRRVVVKVGTSTITHTNGKLNFRHIDLLARTLCDLKNAGHEIILVTSGAIGVGANKLGLKCRPKDIPTRQAAAAVGQSELMHVYDKCFIEYGNVIAQILLTKDILDEGPSRTNAKNAFDRLFELDAIPIVNENDTVAIDELGFGDNDTLSAAVARLVSADLLILLSDIDGFYDRDPREDDEARLIPLVRGLTDEIMESAGGSGSENGTGGMVSKLEAAKIALAAGIPMVITNGDTPQNLYEICEGRIKGTLFLPEGR
jgi:glutamate 5-kinase